MVTIVNSFREHGIYEMESFEFEYGKVVENIDVEWITSGVPRYDDEGYITNAIVFCSNYKGKTSILEQSHEFLKSEGKFDKDEFFFIMITSLGMPNSFSPSTSKMNHEFPVYSFIDVVNFKRQFLRENFKIKKLLGVIGEENGGYEVFTWACEYPDDMKFIMILNSDYKISGYRFVISKGFERIIESNNDYLTDNYAVSLYNSMMAIYTLLFAQSMSEKVFSRLTTDEIEVFLDDFVDDALSVNIYDFNFKNNAILNYNVADKLSNIKARTLIIHSDESVLFNQSLDVDMVSQSIDDLMVLSYSSKRETYYDEEDFSEIGLKIISYLKELLKD